MAAPAIIPVNAAEAWILQRIPSIADGIVRGRLAEGRIEVKLQKWHKVAFGLFSLLGAAGVLTTRVEALETAGLVGAFASIVLLMVFETYRTFGVEDIATRLLDAKKAYSLLEIKVKQALREANPLAKMKDVVARADSLDELFHLVLRPADQTDIDTLEAQWIALRPKSGWCVPQQKPRKKRKPGSQQKPKNKGGMG